MSPVTAVKDMRDSRLAAYRSLKGRSLERQRGIFIAESPRVVKALLQSDVEPVSCLTTRHAYNRYKPLATALSRAGIPVYIAPQGDIQKLIGFRFHQGLLVAARSPEKHSLKEMAPRLKGARLFVALNGVNDPGNVGLIVRNAAAFGADALIVDGQSYDPYYRRAVRVSIGTLFGLNVAYEERLTPALAWLKKTYKTRIIAASPAKGAVSLDKAKLSGNVCLVFGNEEKGITPDIRRIADMIVKIPIAKAVDSLNVASASAILLHAASRQH